jgi:non-specific serine/threonine protein kinase/serine/threonine-protein kinase
MTPDQWGKAKDILDQAMLLEPEKRSAYVADLASHDPVLAGELDSLLLALERIDSSFLNVPAMQLLPETREFSEAAPTLVGRRFGSYEIIERIGCGGMGEVYRAVRADDEYRKQVAIKVVCWGPGSSFMAARFKNERQILAELEHPNIARLLDGGSTEDGSLFFVMELVDGKPLTSFCNVNNLSVTERLKLFLAVCSAVQYAHQHLIIHRDIKPSNILVTSDALPKLLDFGIAKILDPGAPSQWVQETTTLFRALTPEYASPEQFKGKIITTRSDVYSLGMVLYELLARCHPYSIERRNLEDLERMICEVEPEKPSTRVRGISFPETENSKQPSSTTSGASEPTPEKLSRRLVGDLDNIILKAIHKDPLQRYSSVEQVSEDIRRHLDGHPVIARPDTIRYRLSKFVTRHKTGVGAGVLLVLALSSGLATTMWQAHVARTERVRAEQRFNDVRALANSLLFEIHDAIRELPGSTPARKLLVDRALRYLDSLAAERGNAPSLQRELATAYERVGEVQGHYLTDNLGDTGGTLRSYQKAFEIRRQLASGKSSSWQDQLDLAKDYRLVGSQLLATGDSRGAFDHIQNAIAAVESLNRMKPGDQQVLYELSYDYEIAGDIHQGGFGQPVGLSDASGALDSYQKAVAADEALVQLDPSSESAQHSLAMDEEDVGDMLLYSGDQSGALQRFQRALEIAQKIRLHTTATRRIRDVAVAYNRMLGVYEVQGEWQKALENSKKALDVYQQLVPMDPKNTLLLQGLAIALVNTGDMTAHIGNPLAGLRFIDKGEALMGSLLASSPDNAEIRGILATMHETRGDALVRAHRASEALKEYQNALESFHALSLADPNNADAKLAVATCKVQIGRIEAESGNLPSASKYYGDALAIAGPLASINPPNLEALYATANSYSAFGDLQALQASMSERNHSRRDEFWREARLSYQRCLEMWSKIRHPGRVTPQGFPAIDPVAVASSLRRCEVALASKPD